MTITIKPLAHGEHRREVRIGRSGKDYLTKSRGGHVLKGLNRWRAYHGMRFPTVAAARAWLNEQFADVDEERPPQLGPGPEPCGASSSSATASATTAPAHAPRQQLRSRSTRSLGLDSIRERHDQCIPMTATRPAASRSPRRLRRCWSAKSPDFARCVPSTARFRQRNA